MTEAALSTALEKLTEVQREAALWKGGPLLVLAGPGSGKTQVLTCRIASLLDEGKNESFRILALTFTNKAADEMKERVTSLVPSLDERAVVATFHGFCGQVLRQHGVHLGIGPDFVIYSLDDDRRAVLVDALQRARAAGESVEEDDVKVLGLIDRLKSRLVLPENAEAVLTRFDDRARIALIYRLYEEELRRNNALDFNSLILETHRLFVRFPAIATRYRRSHPYWLIDEFQDTTDAQFKLLRAMAGTEFKNMFAVADDDQIIYQWNGASVRQIQRFRADFGADLIQLPTNYRCPPAIVQAANRLVSHNVQRTEAKKPLVAGKVSSRLPTEQHIQLRVYEDATQEAYGVAKEIFDKGRSTWSGTTVLARTRALLDGVHTALGTLGVPAVVSQRRDDFLSAELRFLVACLRQVCRPLDKRNFATLVDAFARIADLPVSTPQLVAEAEATGESYMASWVKATSQNSLASKAAQLHAAASRILADMLRARTTADESIQKLIDAAPKGDEGSADLREDAAVWKLLERDIGRHIGSGAPLDQFLQELQLRSKEPAIPSDAVTLMTVHASKGREFDYVYLIGMAEDTLPSYQSRQKGDDSAEMEEERRNCFVAITRAKESLTLTRARRYRGWAKSPSRFLVEMSLVEDPSS